MTAMLVGLGRWDMRQKRGALRRYYPVMAHFR